MSPDGRLRMTIVPVPVRACPLVASGLFALSIISGGALAADDAALPQPHWSGLPIWGVEAEAKGYQIPVPVWNRDHCLLGPAAGEHPGPAVGAQWASGVGQEFPGDQYGRHVPAERLGKVRRPGLPVPGRLRPRRIHDGNHQGTHPDPRRSHPRHHRASDSAAQCQVQRPDLRRRPDPPRRRQGQRVARPDGHRGDRLEPHPDEADIRKRNGDRRHEAGGVGLLGQGGPARHRRQLQWRGGLGRRDAPEHPAGGRRPRCQYRPSIHRVQSPQKPWNTLLGGLFEFGKDGYVLLEGGLGARMSILAAAVYRF